MSDPYDLTPPIGCKTGLEPRDYSQYPEGCFSWAEPFPDSLLVPKDEIQDRIDDMTAKKSRLLDLREDHYDALKSYNQNGYGLCWYFSTTKAMTYLRARQNEPMIRLSPWWGAGLINHWADRGGWGGVSLKHVVENGIPEYSFCPEYKSSYDNDACRANALLHQCQLWWEGSEDPELAEWQSVSAYLMGLPTVEDFNHMSHSMCGVWMTKWKGDHEKITDNSWGESAGDRGLYRLTGWKCQPNGLWIPRVQEPSEN